MAWPAIDINAATHFLELLGKNGDARFRAFPHKTTPKEVKAVLKARKPCNLKDLQLAQKAGLGGYVVINRGGDTKASITDCIAFFAEFDGKDEDSQIRQVQQSGLPEPSAVVRTNGGSLHFYWVLAQPIQDTAQWQEDMRRLAAHLGSDQSINDPSRVMRLPGCWYMDGNQQPIALVELIHESPARYTRDQIISCLPAPLQQHTIPAPQPRVQPSPVKRHAATSDRTAERALEQLQLIPRRTPGTGTRDKYLRLLWGLAHILGPDQAGAVMASHSPEWAAAEDLTAKAAEAKGAITDGTFFDIARSFGAAPLQPPQLCSDQAALLDQSQTLDDILGPVENGKLRRPRTDLLTKVLALALPLRFNLLTQRIENEGRPIDGDFLGTLYLQLAERFQIEVAKDRACDAAILLARRNAFHPVRDYLGAITTQLPPEQWESIAQYIFITADPVASIHLRRQLIGLVARAMKPGCKLDTAVVIHSPQQGIGKSTLWAILGGDWFSDSLGDLRNLKDDVLQLHSAWIHEWGEIDAVVGKRESETLKKFLSATKDDVRKPYGRGVETLVRSCGIVGTTNRSDFIKDPTGNRRFPVIAVNQVNTDWVLANRDAIWGSALAAFNAGTPWHYDATENAAISKAAQDFAAEDPLRDQIETWMDDHPDITAIAMPVIVYHLNRDRQRDQEFSRQVALRLSALGWSKSQRRERGFLPDGTRHDKATVWELPRTAPPF
jgi:predicted P-loop ATPase